jgi:hypothetical protein
MKARTIALTLALFTVAVAVSFAADNPNIGTWKLNEAKSKFPPDATKNTTVVYEAAGDNVKVTTDGTTGDGKPAHSEWTGKFDGKDYPVTGGADGATRSYKVISANAMEVTGKENGKVTLSGKIVVSADGKSRTVNISGSDTAGKKLTSNAVYDKQ